MQMSRFLYLPCALGLALVMGTAGAAPTDGTGNPPIMILPDFPLSLQEALANPEFQPSTASPGKVGVSTSNSFNLGNWHYTIAYKYTTTGWRFAGYKATRVHTPALAPIPLSKLEVGPANDTGSNPNLAVRPGQLGPGDIPRPKPPTDKNSPGQGGATYACPWPGTNYDVKATFTWVPAHVETTPDDQIKFVPAHWQETGYQMFPHPGGSDLCPK